MKINLDIIQQTTLVLYFVLSIELALLIWRQLYVIEITIFLFAILALIIRLTTYLIRPKFTQWTKVFVFLTQLLSSQEFLPAVEIESEPRKSHIPQELESEIIYEMGEITPLLKTADQEFVSELREIGVDGLVILIYLMKQAPRICSTKVIEKELKIPIATIYRTLSKMEKNVLITTTYSFDRPNTALYAILPDGESIIINLFDLMGGYQHKLLP